jgi:hypothetical protein
MQFKDYQLVSHINYQQFENYINKGLQNGWTLVGGTCVVNGLFNGDGQADPNGKLRIVFFQAMAK